MRIALIILVIFVLSFAAESSGPNGRGTRPLALSGAFTAVASDPWVVWYNPAGLSTVKALSSALSCVPRPFEVKELRTISASLVFPARYLNVGVSIDDFGSSLYRESSFVIGGGLTVAREFSAGISLGYRRVAIDRYGSQSLVTADLGLRLELSENVAVGYVWHNLPGAKIGNSDERILQQQTLGVSYAPHRQVQLTCDLEKESWYPFTLHAGAELHLLPELDMRFGCSDNPGTITSGLGIKIREWECSYALQYHPQLGFTHAFEISYELQR